MITYVVKTFLGLVLFDKDLNHIPTEDGIELPPFYISISDTILFTPEEREEQEMTEVMDESYVSTVREALVSRMVRKASEILINIEKHRMKLKYYPKIKKAYPTINEAVVKTIKESLSDGKAKSPLKKTRDKKR